MMGSFCVGRLPGRSQTRAHGKCWMLKVQVELRRANRMHVACAEVVQKTVEVPQVEYVDNVVEACTALSVPKRS